MRVSVTLQGLGGSKEFIGWEELIFCASPLEVNTILLFVSFPLFILDHKHILFIIYNFI